MIQSLSSVPEIPYPILLFDASLQEGVDSLLSTTHIANRFSTCLPIITFALAKSTFSSSTFFFSDSNSSFFPFYKIKPNQLANEKFVVFLCLLAKLIIHR